MVKILLIVKNNCTIPKILQITKDLTVHLLLMLSLLFDSATILNSNLKSSIILLKKKIVVKRYPCLC